MVSTVVRLKSSHCTNLVWLILLCNTFSPLPKYCIKAHLYSSLPVMTSHIIRTLISAWLTHCGPMMPNGIFKELGHHLFRKCLGTCLVPNHCLIQCRLHTDQAIRSKLRRNLNQNTNIISQESAMDNVLSKIWAIIFRPQCIKHCYVKCFAIA